MRRAAGAAFHALDLALLRGASLLVPFPHRGEWYREWRAELWHVRRDCGEEGFSWAGEREVMDFCLGAVPDAAWFRRERGEVAVASASAHGSAYQCLLYLCSVLMLSAIVARLLPGIRAEELGSRIELRRGVVLIERAEGGAPSIPFSVYRGWAAQPQRFFDGLAYYSVEREATGLHDSLRVGHTTDALFHVLGVGLPAGDDGPGVPRALLSEHLWRTRFHSDPHAVGAIIRIGGRQVQVAGIAPPETVRLPGQADLWILESETLLALTPPMRNGFVMALLSPLAQARMERDAIDISTFEASGEDPEFRGITLRPEDGGPTSLYLFALLLAVLALPAITSTFQSETSFASHQPSLRTRAKRWAFMAAKLALVAGLGYCGGLDLAYWHVAQYSPSAELVQFAASFLLCLFGLRWAIVDQSRRCPVCLRRVTHPAQVGIASCNFLGWNGTEMICTGGHALLHVPSLPTSWFSRQRWMYLDTSWDFLFGDSAGH